MKRKYIMILGIQFTILSSQFYTPCPVWASASEENDRQSSITRFFPRPSKVSASSSSSPAISQLLQTEDVITSSSEGPTPKKLRIEDGERKNKKKRIILENEEEEYPSKQLDDSSNLNPRISASSSSSSSTSQLSQGNKNNPATSSTTSKFKKPRVSASARGKQKKLSSESEEEQEDCSSQQPSDVFLAEESYDTSRPLNDIHFALAINDVSDINQVLNKKALALLKIKPSDPARLIRRNVTIQGQPAAIFMEIKKLARPSWAQVFISYLEEQDQGTHIIQDALQEYSGLIFLNVAGRIFVAIFGPGGRHLVNTQMLDPDFGKHAALNNIEASDHKAVRKIGVLMPLFNPRFVETMFLQGTSINNLGTSGSTPRLLRNVRGKGQSLPDREKGKHISSGGPCAIWHNFTPIKEFPEVCEELLRLSQKKDYKNNFSWIEDLKPVIDKDQIDDLEAHLIKGLHTLPLENWSLFSPHPDDSSAIHYQVNKVQTKYSSLEEVQQVVAGKVKQGANLTNLKKTMVRPFDGRDEALKPWNVYKGLLFEKTTNKGTYILVAGTWYLVDTGCIESLNRDINKLFLTEPHPFLDLLSALTPAEAAKGTTDDRNEREKKYNMRMSEKNPEYFMLMDARNASLDKGNRKDIVEVCDLLSPERYLIHIKNWTGSATFSHLLNQGLSSANMLLEPSYRKKAQRLYLRAEILEYLHLGNYFEDNLHKEGFTSELKKVFDNSEILEENKLDESINLIQSYFGKEVIDEDEIVQIGTTFYEKKTQFEKSLPSIEFTPSNHTIVYAFFHKDHKMTLSEYLPIFSRLALREVNNCLRNLGYKDVLVKKIDYPPKVSDPKNKRGKGKKSRASAKGSESLNSSASQTSSSSSSSGNQVS